MIKFLNKNKNKGAIITLVLVFGAIFVLLLAGLLSFILIQHRGSFKKAAWNDSLHIAEAGMNYYRWHLNQYIEADNPDIQDGKDWCCKDENGIEYGQDAPECENEDFIVCGRCDGEPCYEHDYYNPQGELIGKFILEIKAKKICDQILGVYVNSTGFTNKFPNLKRKVEAKFASTSVADYTYMLNDPVWAGGDREIFGKYHSNSGIRMDGNHNSLVTSASNTWIFGRSFGCCGDPCKWNSGANSCYCPNENRVCCGFMFFGHCIGWWGCDSVLDCNTAIPEGSCSNYDNDDCSNNSDCQWADLGWECSGVWGGGSPQDLWKFPVTCFDFDGITANLSRIKNLSNDKGLYFGPSGEKGYHVIFKDNGRFDIKVITGLWSGERIISYSEEDTQLDVPLPSECGLIFVEDNLWVEGTVKGKITIASADLISEPSIDTSVFLNWNIDYSALDGSDSLAVITEKDILIPLDSPNEMILRGVFVAQKGHFGRNYYYCGVLSPHRPECERDELIIYGSIVSNGRVGTKWIYSSSGDFASGYKQRYNYFDAKLSRDPPPLLPYVSEELKLISWEEIQ